MSKLHTETPSVVPAPAVGSGSNVDIFTDAGAAGAVLTVRPKAMTKSIYFAFNHGKTAIANTSITVSFQTADGSTASFTPGIELISTVGELHLPIRTSAPFTVTNGHGVQACRIYVVVMYE